MFGQELQTLKLKAFGSGSQVKKLSVIQTGWKKVGSCLQGVRHAPQQCVCKTGWNGERCDQSTDHKVLDIERVVVYFDQ